MRWVDLGAVRVIVALFLWCENATLLTGTPWRYLKVPQKEFEKLQPVEFGDLMVLG